MIEIKLVPGSARMLKMTDAEYFSNRYRDYVSNSKLSLINPDEGGDFRKFELGIENKYSDSFELGSLVHGLLLQPDEYEIATINKPSAKLGVFAEEVFKLRQDKNCKLQDALLIASENADYFALKLTKTRQKTAIKGCLPFYLARMHYQLHPTKTTIFASKANLEKSSECLKSLRKKEILEILKPEDQFNFIEIFNEYAILADLECIDKETGVVEIIKIKAKLDNVVVNYLDNEVILNDLKTTGKPIDYFMGNYVKVTKESGEESIEFYEGSFTKYHYYRQMAFYLWLLKEVFFEKPNMKFKVNMVVVETFGEYKSKVFPIKGKDLSQGIKEFVNLLKLVAEWKLQK